LVGFFSGAPATARRFSFFKPDSVASLLANAVESEHGTWILGFRTKTTV